MTQCRLCYLEINSNNFKNIFSEKHDPPLWKLIGKLANIKISETDPYTKLICSDCFLRLNKSCEFLEMILETDNKLRHTSFCERQIKIEENHDCMSEIEYNSDSPPVEIEDEECDYILVEEDIEIVEHKLKFDDGADYIDDMMITNEETDENTDQKYQNETQITNEVIHNSKNNNNIDHKEKINIDIDHNENNINIDIDNKKNNDIDHSGNKINTDDHIEDNKNQTVVSECDNKSTVDQSLRKGYQCDFCNRRFIHKYFFKSHVLSHKNDVKPFRCSICEREFRRKCHLFNHRRSCWANYKG